MRKSSADSLKQYGAMYGTIWGIGVGLIMLYLVSMPLWPLLALLPEWLLIATGLLVAAGCGIVGCKAGVVLSQKERNNPAAAVGLFIGIVLAIACSIGFRLLAFNSLRTLSVVYVVPINLILITMFAHVGWMIGGNVGRSKIPRTRQLPTMAPGQTDANATELE